MIRGAAELLRANVRYWLHERQMSKSALSRAMGVSPSWVTELIRGRRGLTLDKLDGLARALNITVSALFVDRDLSRQTQVVEGLRPIFQGAPDDPSERETYYRAVIQAFTEITKVGVDVATAAVKEAEAFSPRKPDVAPRPRRDDRRSRKATKRKKT